ncbi:uncharacterized protein LOC132304260 [Cornus florida]|uniref:uncharacterized protein LOC132304260 n=1 Tax=Cornus florida TaxID=4283 RepID=UPI00289AF060|nr:uncharacterized protein LOC132304260 [Cornus florida]
MQTISLTRTTITTNHTMSAIISRSIDNNNNPIKPSTSSCSDFSGNQTGPKIVPSVSCSLKRKRPPGIEIPNVLREIRTETELAFRDSTHRHDTVSFGGSGVGVLSVKGKKKFMEDTYKIISCSHGNKGFFGVYDGHGGRKAADFAAETLHANIFEMLENSTRDSAKEELVKAGYLKTDQEFLKQGLGSGTCCVTALIEGKEIVISNLGDCRAVLSRSGVAEALTKDHRAGQEDERKRIEDKGGYVELHRGAWRVHGILSVSRSIGDAHLKDWVPAEPDLRTLFLTQDMEYLVLASDGLWEKVGNQEAVDMVMQSCLVEKKLGSTGHNGEENDDKTGLIYTSPSSKLRRISLVKQKKMMGHSPSNKKSVDISKENENDFACENGSPASKVRRISLINQISMNHQSPKLGNSCYKTSVDSWKENENDFFTCENESPPSKVRRISLINQMNMNSQSPKLANSGYKKRPSSDGLLAACNELVNRAVSRGSLDDITVMIIDLNQFKCGIPACFSSRERPIDDPTNVITRSGQSLLMSVYRTKIAGQCRLITITWYKNLLLHGLTVSIQVPNGDNHCHCKVELKPWLFWRKQGTKHLVVEGKSIDVVWDLKAAKFNGEIEPQSDYYVAIVCDEEVVLLSGDQKKDAYRRTGCRPSLIEPVLVSKKEHIFGKNKFLTRAEFHEKGRFHDITIECYSVGGFDSEMEIKIDGNLVIHVKHLQWKFRGNESIHVNKARLEVYWDVHDWLFSSGLRRALFIFKPILSSPSSSISPSPALVPSSSSLTSTLSTTLVANSTSAEEYNACGTSEFCLFIYAWKVD